MSEIIALSEENFETETTGSLPVVVDFYADWCGPCQSMSPIFEQLAEAYEGKIRFCKLNIDGNRKLAIANQVMNIPTFLFLKDGRQLDRHTGSMTEAEFEEKLKALL